MVAATPVEPPSDLLQGTEVSGRGATQQHEREPHTIQQAKETGQLYQPGKLANSVQNKYTFLDLYSTIENYIHVN